jgi:predicted secreted hydrolase
MAVADTGRALVLLLGCAVALAACTHGKFERLDFERMPAATDFGAHRVPMEWWYVASVAEDEGLAFHVAFFRGYPPPSYRVAGIPAPDLLVGPLFVSHIAVTDLERDTLCFDERRSLPWESGCVSHPPLRIIQHDRSLTEDPTTGVLHLRAGPVDVLLEPMKPATIHPPGFSGSESHGRLFYQSITRLRATGRVNGRDYDGLAWLDHQWGDGMPCETLVWDWCCLHADDGSDLMLTRVTSPEGDVLQVLCTRTDAAGSTTVLENPRMTPTQLWTSKSGRTYRVAWRVEADDLTLEVEPLRLQQEILSKTACTAYWECPVRSRGTFAGRAIEGRGMAESVYGFLRKPPDVPVRATIHPTPR